MGNSPVTGEFPAQRASNAENVSIWWRHHEIILKDMGKMNQPQKKPTNHKPDASFDALRVLSLLHFLINLVHLEIDFYLIAMSSGLFHWLYIGIVADRKLLCHNVHKFNRHVTWQMCIKHSATTLFFQGDLWNSLSSNKNAVTLRNFKKMRRTGGAIHVIAQCISSWFRFEWRHCHCIDKHFEGKPKWI